MILGELLVVAIFRQNVFKSSVIESFFNKHSYYCRTQSQIKCELLEKVDLVD